MPKDRTEYSKEYRKRNAERIRKRKKEYYQSHREQATAQVRQWRAKLRSEVIEFLGGKCTKCGFDDPRALQIDHIHGGGHRDYRSHKNQYDFYKVILEKRRSDLQLLCANCNWIKRHDNKEHGQG